jgi:hypothetical protein
MKTPYIRRVVPGAVLTLIAIALALSAFGQGELTPGGPPAPTMKTLDQLDTAIAQTNAKVDHSNAKIDALAAQGTTEKFYASPQTLSIVSAGCASVTIPAGRLIKLESVYVTTFGGTSASARLEWNVRRDEVNPAILQGIPITAISSGGNTRTGNMQIPLLLRGGTVAEASEGEAYGLRVCVGAPSSSETVGANWYLTGVYE